jgi:hypothetical protein
MRSERDTEVRKTLRPGQPGTRRLQRDWGARLVCVRHRVDPVKGVRFTTAEIVVSRERATGPRRTLHPDALVYARVGADEWELERRLRAARTATFDPELNLWRMRFETAVRLKLRRRLMLRRPTRNTPSSATASHSNISAHRRLNIPIHPRQNQRELE